MINLSGDLLYYTGEVADSVMGHRSTVHLRCDRSTLAGWIHSVQMARRPSLGIHHVLRRWR